MTSTEEKNTSEDAEMADCDGEKVVTMMDVLQEQEEFEDDVNAVLGASDEKNCTYSKVNLCLSFYPWISTWYSLHCVMSW